MKAIEKKKGWNIVLSERGEKIGTLELWRGQWRFAAEDPLYRGPQEFETVEDALAKIESDWNPVSTSILDQNSEMDLMSVPFREPNIVDDDDEREDGGRNWKRYRVPEGYARGLKGYAHFW